MTVLIDSWAWIEYWKGGKYANNAMRHIEGEDEAFVSTINILETYFWVTKYYGENVAKNKISTMEKRCYVVPVEKKISIEAAKLKLKHKLGIADSIVLATAMHVGGKLVTGDPDFKDIDSVILINE